MRRLALLAAVIAAGAAACGSSPSRQLSGDPATWLIGLDQLASPDFTVSQAVRSIDPATFSAGDSGLAGALQQDGWQAGATVQYFRDVGAIASANGPVQVIAIAIRFPGSDGASDAFHRDIVSRDRLPGAVQASTGDLGDEAHSDSITASAADGTRLVEVSVDFRVANVLNVITVRGRYGGTRLDDALVLAHRQASNEINGPPSPTPVPTPTVTPSPGTGSTASPSATATPGPQQNVP